MFTLMHSDVQRGLKRTVGHVFFSLPILLGDAVLFTRSKHPPLLFTGTTHPYSVQPEAGVHTGSDINNLSFGLGFLLKYLVTYKNIIF